MKRSISFASLPALALVLGITCHASAALAQAYGGIAVGNQGKQRWIEPSGAVHKPSERELPVLAYGGYRFDEAWALEGGFGRMTDAEFATSGGRASADSKLAYIAVKRSFAIGERLGWYFKGGIANNTLRIDGPAGLHEKNDRTRLMGAVGLDYRITPNVVAVAEVAAYGRVRTPKASIAHNLLQLGLRFDF
ncbi:outer membrane beta-barrel protein [Pseudoduganella buxea]|nr:outer membrane beta-barrel protein [Pseudoduganella buxea]GGB88562.1 hypothetical protein GCM10011572_08270 [Pseudoduganella buxea]